MKPKFVFYHSVKKRNFSTKEISIFIKHDAQVEIELNYYLIRISKYQVFLTTQLQTHDIIDVYYPPNR